MDAIQTYITPQTNVIQFNVPNEFVAHKLKLTIEFWEEPVKENHEKLSTKLRKLRKNVSKIPLLEREKMDNDLKMLRDEWGRDI